VDLAAPAVSGEKPGPCTPVQQPAAQITPAPLLPSATPGRQWPSTPITYQGDVGGAPLVMTIDFRSGTVTGTFSLTGEDYINTEVEGGFLSANLLVDAERSKPAVELSHLGAEDKPCFSPWPSIPFTLLKFNTT